MRPYYIGGVLVCWLGVAAAAVMGVPSAQVVLAPATGHSVEDALSAVLRFWPLIVAFCGGVWAAAVLWVTMREHGRRLGKVEEHMDRLVTDVAALRKKED